MMRTTCAATVFIALASTSVAADDLHDAIQRGIDAATAVGFACGYVAGQVDAALILTGRDLRTLETTGCKTEVLARAKRGGFKFPPNAAEQRGEK